MPSRWHVHTSTLLLLPVRTNAMLRLRIELQFLCHSFDLAARGRLYLVEAPGLGISATEQLVYVVWTRAWVSGCWPRRASTHLVRSTCASISAPSAESPVPVLILVHPESHAQTFNLSQREERVYYRPAIEAPGNLQALGVHVRAFAADGKGSSCIHPPLQTKPRCVVVIELEKPGAAPRAPHGVPGPFQPIPSCRQRSANQCIGEPDEPPCTCTLVCTVMCVLCIRRGRQQFVQQTVCNEGETAETRERCSATVSASSSAPLATLAGHKASQMDSLYDEYPSFLSYAGLRAYSLLRRSHARETSRDRVAERPEGQARASCINRPAL
ncbi:hypothetical protein J3F83DRAFT_400725 [Trichoderma novae-zelandiae]